jgi:hypothetical protein
MAEEGEAILPRINPSARSGDDKLRMATCVLGSSSRMIAITAGKPFGLVTGQEAEDQRRLGGCSPSAKARNLAANSSEASK